MKNLISIIFVLFHCFLLHANHHKKIIEPVPVNIIKHHYIQTEKGGESTKFTNVETIKDNHRIIITVSKDGDFKETIHGNKSTNYWSITSKKESSTISATVSNNIIILTKILKGKTTTKTLELKGLPLKQPVSLFAKDFINSKKKRIDIWTVNGKKLSLQKMILTKLGKETITLGNKKISALKIEMKPPGLSGMVWKAYYWLDESTGHMLQYKGKKGPPGTPDFLIQRILR